MNIEDFKAGDLLVPDENIMSAFAYDPEQTELIEGTEYRKATYSEMIWLFKNKGRTEMNEGVEAYKRTKQNDVNAVYKSIEKSNANERKN